MRILIDCSYINFQAQPSGVPRVVSSYVEWGYRWGETRGIEVIPVVPKARGIYVVHPAPGVPPAYLNERATIRGFRKTVRSFGSLAYGAGRLGRSVVRKLLHSAAGRFDSPHNNSVFYRIDERLTELARRVFLYVLDRAPNPHRISLQSGDLLFCPAYWHDVEPAIYRNIRAQGCTIVTLVHDLLPITLADQYPSPWREQFRVNLLQALDYASAFVCVSEVTRQALHKFARNSGKHGHFATAHSGYQPVGTCQPTVRSKRLDFLFKSDRRPLLMVGSIEPKKGHLRVLDVLERKWSSGYDRPLAIAGRPGWLSSDIVRRIRHSAYFGKRLFWFDDFSDDDLSFAYSRCHALVFASLAEGFGLPLIEASMDRKPSIVFRTAIAEEILGGYGVFFDELPDALSVILDRLEDLETYSRIQQRLGAFTWPAWRETVAGVFDCLVASRADWTAFPAAIEPTPPLTASTARAVKMPASQSDRQDPPAALR